MKYKEIKETILKKLDIELASDLYYHSIDHTLDVLMMVEKIGEAEGLNEEDILLLKIAALFHDSGFIRTYDGHEEESVRIAENILTEYGVEKEIIEKISKLILITKVGSKPSTLMEKVMIDADLDYLGRNDFSLISQKLFMEWKKKGIVKDLNEFYKRQFEFLQNHEFYTNTSIINRKDMKEKQLKKLKEILLIEE